MDLNSCRRLFLRLGKAGGEYLKKSLSQGTQMGFVETPEAL